MKKILLCAAVVALAAACTNEDDFAMSQDNTRTKGLTFDVALAEGAATKGELWKDENGTYPFFWYAETDKIDVFALNNVAGEENGELTKEHRGIAQPMTNDQQQVTGGWNLNNGSSEYKATQSSGSGKFTAKNDADLISLVKVYDSKDVAGTTTTIVAAYGKVQATEITSKVNQGKIVPGELTGLVLTTTESNSVQTVDRANVVDAPMYSVSTAIKEEVYNSLGERANLSLIRPFPVIRFTTKNTKDYIEDFGELMSVELEALGVLKDGVEDPQATRSILAYAGGKKYAVVGSTLGFVKNAISGLEQDTEYGVSEDSAKVTVNLTDGAWSDGDAVYMTVAPVSRKGFKGKKEALKVKYQFENITFTLNPGREGATDFEKALQTSNDWTAVDAAGNPNAITPLPALDINNYNYLVTGDDGEARTLIVIKGDFKDVFAENGEVAWNGETVSLSDIEKITSKVALTNDELATIKDFTGLKDLTLAENTDIPAKTFSANQASLLESLNLPKVTSVDKNFVTNKVKLTKLKTLIMPAYGFNDADVNGVLLNNEEIATGRESNKVIGNKMLETLDMSGVASMMPTFGVERTMAFTNYIALKTVTVKDKVVVAPNGFAGCAALETINGKLDISDASDAFNMKTAYGMSEETEVEEKKRNGALKSVEVCGTVIPDGAFTNCVVLGTVKYNGSAIVPTSIGESAFENTAVEYMDLSKAATIGRAAFKSSNLKSTSSTITTLTVGAKKLTESMFESTKVRMVKFTDATEIAGPSVFMSASDLIQVKFEKVFTLANAPGNSGNDYYENVFGSDTRKIDFWTNPSQSGVSGNELTLKIGTSGKTQIYTFKSIQKRLD